MAFAWKGGITSRPMFLITQLSKGKGRFSKDQDGQKHGSSHLFLPFTKKTVSGHKTD